MERIKQQVDQLQKQLAGLTPSQKMLVGTLVAVMVITVVWWTRYAASGEMTALLEQPLNPDQTGQIQRHLAHAGITYDTTAGTIRVPATRRDEALALLSYERALPEDTTRHFDQALGNIGSFDPRQKIDLTILSARQDELGAAIGHWPGVRAARVHVNETYKRQVGGDVLPSAGVTITTTGSADDRKLADSAAHLVASAFPMLRPAAVDVIVDGQLVRTDDEDAFAAGGSKLLDLRAKAERYLEQKLQNQFRYIPDLYVTVTVDVNDKITRTTEQTVDPTSKLIVPVQSTIESDSSENGANAGGEGGFGSNVPLAVPQGGAASQSESRESETVTNAYEVSRTHREIYAEAGKTTATKCTLSVPLSWVRTQWQSRNNTTDTPSLDVLRTFEVQIRESLADMARVVLDTTDEGSVLVVTYADAGGLNAASGLAAAGAMEADMGISAIVQDYGKPTAVVALAGVALFLVSSMVKKSAPVVSSTSIPMPADFAGYGDMSQFLGEEDLAEAGGADPLLVGQEIADDQLQAGQMVEQVQSLVKENPDAAAQLVKRWLGAS